MSDAALDRFRLFLSRRATALGVSANTERELLVHEMGATINRHRLTGRDEGMNAFNTSQLAGLVVAQQAWSREQPFVTGLMLSALIDGEVDIFDAAKDEGLLPPVWTWVAWAQDYHGDESDLRQRIHGIAAIRERCGAVCLAVRTCPAAIGVHLLGEFCQPVLAKVYHRLLAMALTGPSAGAIATHELKRLTQHLEVLFAADTDATLAALVRASDVDHPEVLTAAYQDAAGDLTCTAIAGRHLERGRPGEALELVRNLRFLSSAYDQAVVVAALAAIETGKTEMAEFYCRAIADENVRLKITTRLAQSTGDTATELDSLTTLYQRQPHDAQVFVQLINTLLRIGQTALAQALCAEAQERFFGDVLVERLVRSVLTRPG